MKSGTNKLTGLMDEAVVQQTSKKQAQFRCQIRTVMNALSEDSKKELRTVLDNSEIDSVTIATLLQAKGFNVSKYGVRRHRNKDCICNREVA